MPQVVALRQAVVDFLNAQALGVTATGAYEAAVDLEQFAPLSSRLLVIPRDLAIEFLTFDAGGGSEDARKLSVFVVLQYHASTLSTTELDPIVTLAETIAEKCLGQSLPITPKSPNCMVADVHWTEGIWNLEHLKSYKVLTIPLELVLQQVD